MELVQIAKFDGDMLLGVGNIALQITIFGPRIPW